MHIASRPLLAGVAVAALVLFAIAGGCESAPYEEILGDKACTPEGVCAEGYHCVSNKCRLDGSGGAGNAPVGAGGAGGAGGMGPCDSITDCPPPETDCEKAVCLGGLCGTIAEQGGFVLGARHQVAGDCKTKSCDGLGHVVQENDDLDLPDDALECTQDFCISGVDDHQRAKVGTACVQGGGAFCDAVGNCAECIVASDCTALPADDFCQQRACDAGMCMLVFTASGTALPAQTVGDCKKLACNGSGASEIVDDTTDAPNDSNDCTTDSCIGGLPDYDPRPLGTLCLAGACNATGQCLGCTLPTDCGADTFCQQRTCAANTCGFSYTNAGTALPVAQQNGGDCQTLTCNGAGGVQSMADNADLPLEDGTVCTGETCVNGTVQLPPTPLDAACNEGGGTVCNGAGACVACNSPGQCSVQGSVCQDATCSQNLCGVAPKASGEPAKAGAQTLGDCQIVLCNGTGQTNPPSNSNGDLPSDGNACTNDVCTNGAPSNPPVPAGSPCGGGGQCNATGSCGPATKPDGAPCVLGAECFSANCVDGVCCESACGGICNACIAADTGGSDGSCDPIPVGQDPDVECSITQTCNGSGACAFTCGQDPDPVGGACPSACTGGCLNGTCIIDCNADSACEADTINCPAGFACTVECGPTDGCKNATINCPTRYACNIECSDCEGANVNCSSGVCNLTCGAGSKACKNLDLACGGNTCSASCNGSTDLPLVACGGSCDCTTCQLANGQACSGNAQCQSNICPGADGVCCNSACTGLCRSCIGTSTGGASGTCAFISAGLDPNGECPGAQTCNGNGACQP